MKIARRAGWIGLGTGVALLVVGLLITGGSAIAAGDWWLAREPWISDGLNLALIGLAVTGVFTLWLDIVEPLGWLRLLAVLPALAVAMYWSILLVFGIPTGGGQGHDPVVIVYSLGPGFLASIVAATVLLALPLVPMLVARLRQVVSTRRSANS